MKTQFSYLLDFDNINEDHYFLIIPSFDVRNTTETQLAHLEHMLEKRYAKDSNDIKQQMTTLRQKPEFIFQNWLHDYLMSEFGDTYILFDDIKSMISYLEKEYDIKGKKLKIHVAKIFVMSEDTRKPIGEFQYKIHKDMI